jgi:hypothetical protein
VGPVPTTAEPLIGVGVQRVVAVAQSTLSDAAPVAAFLTVTTWVVPVAPVAPVSPFGPCGSVSPV